MKPNKNVYFALDEGGSISGDFDNRYYIIGGLITTEWNKVRRKYKENKKILQLPLKCEHKATRMSNEQKISFLNSLIKIKNTFIIAIIFDKEKNTFIQNNEHINNQLLKYMLNYLNLCEINIFKNSRNIKIYLDQRSKFIGYPKELNKFIQEQFKEKNTKLLLVDSKKYKQIQFADIVANHLYRRFNNKEKDLITKKLLKNRKEYISYFPYKGFGK